MAIIVNNARAHAPKVAILSDFVDFYDHTFYPRGMADAIWDRRSRMGPQIQKQHEQGRAVLIA